MTVQIAPGWNDELQAFVIKETENWVVCVVPMIYNDRITLSTKDEWTTGYTAGFCYNKGETAVLAAQIWDPETEQYPLAYKKIACDAR